MYFKSTEMLGETSKTPNSNRNSISPVSAISSLISETTVKIKRQSQILAAKKISMAHEYQMSQIYGDARIDMVGKAVSRPKSVLGTKSPVTAGGESPISPSSPVSI